jgi:hypothetical protein
LRSLAASHQDFPAVLFVAQGSVEAGNAFFNRYWPEARAVSDEERVLYSAFSLGRVELIQFLHPLMWWRGLKAILKGHGTGQPHGDVLQRPGMALIRHRQVLWQHRSQHPADRPSRDALPGLLRQAAADHRKQNLS